MQLTKIRKIFAIQRFKFIVIVHVILFSCFAQLARTQERFSVQQVLTKAIQNNFEIKQSILKEELSVVAFQQAKSAYYPRITSRSTSAIYFGRNVDPFTNQFINSQINTQNLGIGMEVQAFSGKLRVYEKQLKQKELLANKLETKITTEQLLFKVLAAYVEALEAKDLLKISLRHADLAVSRLLNEKKMFFSGYRTVIDTSHASSQLSKSKLDLAKNERNYRSSIQQICRLMEIDIDTQLELIVPDTTKTFDTKSYLLDEILSYVTKHNGRIGLGIAKVEVAQKDIDIAKAGKWPAINLNANLFSGYSSNGQRILVINKQTVRERAGYLYQLERNFNQSLGLTFVFPIINSGTKYDTKRARLGLEKAKLEQTNLMNDLILSVRQAFDDFQFSLIRLSLSENTLRSSKTSFSAVLKRYNLKLANSFQYNEALAGLYEAEVEATKARYELLFMTKILDIYQGRSIYF